MALFQCKKLGSEDYVEVRGGDGLDPSMMSVAEDFCGMDSVPGEDLLSYWKHLS